MMKDTRIDYYFIAVNSSPLDKMATISQTIFSDAFSWMKSFVFWLYFAEVCSLESNWQTNSTGLYIGLAPNRRQAIIWTNVRPILWRIYAALVGDELTLKLNDAQENHFNDISNAINVAINYKTSL